MSKSASKSTKNSSGNTSKKPHKQSKQGLYPYTLQPVALQLTEHEFKQAQLSLFEKSAQKFGLSSIKLKEWLIMAVMVALAIAGLIFVKGYSTILFWIMLVLVVVYILVRTLGMKWYVKREFEKQMAETDMPEEMEDIKLGVQKNGLVMSMPAPQSATNSKGSRGKGKKSMMQMKMPSRQQAVIPWDAVTSWDETNDFVFVMFEMQEQRGSQIIPKRVQNNQFPLDSLRKHLLAVKEKGIQAVEMD